MVVYNHSNEFLGFKNFFQIYKDGIIKNNIRNVTTILVEYDYSILKIQSKAGFTLFEGHINCVF